MAAGALRDGLTYLDVALLLELVSTARLGDADPPPSCGGAPKVLIAEISSGASASLPGRAPTWAEQTARWVPR